MATTVVSQSNYSGREAGAIIGKMFKEANTLSNNLVTVIENVNYKLNLRKIELTGGRRAYTCGFVPAGSITLSEKVLEPTKMKDDFEVCKEDFRNQWNDGDLGASAWNDGDMKPIMDAILAEKLAQEAEAFEDMIWNGSVANTSPQEFDGFLTQFDLDVDIIRVAGTTITEANVLTEMKKAVAAIPVALKNSPNLKIAVSSNVAQFYYFDLITKGIGNGLGGDANTTMRFGKYALVEVNGLPDNTIVIFEPKNLVFATGLQNDLNDIRLVDSDATHLDGKIIGSMVYNAGVGYYNGEEIVWYTTDATPPSV